jgi:hypothetical protein
MAWGGGVIDLRKHADGGALALCNMQTQRRGAHDLMEHADRNDRINENAPGGGGFIDSREHAYQPSGT